MSGRNMLRMTIVALTAVPCFFGVARGQKDYTTPIEVDPASKARIEFLDKSWDFGVIPRGELVYHNFALRNTGSDTLVITKVKPTCGCTAAPLSSDRIAPGDTAEIVVTLNTAKLRGKVRKFVNVDCNDPINPYYKLSFEAMMDSTEQLISVDPLVADFGDFKQGETPEIELKITNTGEAPINLSVADKPDDNIMAIKLGKADLGSGETTSIGLKIIKEVETGPFGSTLAIESAGDPSTRISVPIKGNSKE